VVHVRDVASLRAAVEGGATPSYLMFWGHTAKEGQVVGPWVLSQWWYAPFIVEGETFATAEHWMMAGKARLFGDAPRRSEILDAADPKTAKALGRKVQGFDDRTWNEHRFELVIAGNLAKFSQHDDLRDYLLSTGEQVIVEASPHDRIWGIGMRASAAKANDPRLWLGRNLLGFALMEVRARLADPDRV
jgi:ribA/ribD-fused uncharacterized protein